MLLECEKLKRFLKRDYKQHFHITSHGTTFHDTCINHCLLYAFGQYNESHTRTCNDCQTLFQFFDILIANTNISDHEELEDLYDHLLYYLAYQTRKVYLNAQFNANLLSLNEKIALILVNYKIKILPKSV